MHTIDGGAPAEGRPAATAGGAQGSNAVAVPVLEVLAGATFVSAGALIAVGWLSAVILKGRTLNGMPGTNLGLKPTLMDRLSLATAANGIMPAMLVLLGALLVLVVREGPRAAPAGSVVPALGFVVSIIAGAMGLLGTLPVLTHGQSELLGHVDLLEALGRIAAVTCLCAASAFGLFGAMGDARVPSP